MSRSIRASWWMFTSARNSVPAQPHQANAMNHFRSSVQRGAGLGAILALLGGCAVGPNFVRPAPPDTDRYTHEAQSEATVAADGQAQHFTPGADDPCRLVAAFQVSRSWTLWSGRPSPTIRPSRRPRPACVRVRTTCARVMACTSRKARLEHPPAGSAPRRVQQGSQTSGSIFNLLHRQRHHQLHARRVRWQAPDGGRLAGPGRLPAL